MEKRKTLNAEKRKAIANVFQQHFEQNSKFNELHKKRLRLTILYENKRKLKWKLL